MRCVIAILLVNAVCSDPVRAQVWSDGDSLSGTWTAQEKDAGFCVTLRSDDHDWYQMGTLQLDDLPQDGVALELDRDAGHVTLEGRRRGDRAVGFFTFRPNAGFNDEMRRIGYPPFDSMQLLLLAAIDAQLSEIARLPGLGYPNLSKEELTAMLIHGALGDHIIDLRQLGFDRLSVDDLLATRIHGVDRDFVESIEALGYRHVSLDELIAMRVQDVTAEYIVEMGRALKGAAGK